MRIGFTELGKLAGSLLRNGHDLMVRDLDRAAAAPLPDRGAGWADSPAELAAGRGMLVTCLPSPAASAAVIEGADGILPAIRPGAIWAEMSTEAEAPGHEVRPRGREAEPPLAPLSRAAEPMAR